jgi:large subunit ribosomal protein L20
MSRVKGGIVTRRRRKKVLKATSGYRERRGNTFAAAHEQLMRSLQYAYFHRKQKKRDYRKLWIARINAAARMNGTKYSELISLLAKADIQLDRKALADLAIFDPGGFTRLVETARAAA